MVTKNKNGSTSIEHYVVAPNGEKKLVGLSGISKEGKLDHALEVPKEWRGQDISKRIYAEADSIGFSTIEGAYGPTSTNFKEFWKHYNPTLGNAAEALATTPAGKAALARGLVPNVKHIGQDIIRVEWVRQ